MHNLKQNENEHFKSVCKVTKLTVDTSLSVHPSALLSVRPSICQSHGTWFCLDGFMSQFNLRTVCSKISPEN